MHKIKKVSQTSQTGPTMNIYQCSCGARFGAKTKQDAELKIEHREQ